MMKKSNECPCCSGKTYTECCQKAHNNIESVITAEQLMRSRYTAFTQGNGDYLMLSHHNSTCPYNDKQSIIDWANSVIWLKLEIIKSTLGKESDEEGFVEFKAFYSEGYIEKYIHENSKFVKEDGNWVYLEAN